MLVRLTRRPVRGQLAHEIDRIVLAEIAGENLCDAERSQRMTTAASPWPGML